MVDYAVRGFTRDGTGDLMFQDHPLQRLPEALSPAWFDVYEIFDRTADFERTWQMKMLQRNLPPTYERQLRKIMQLGPSAKP